MKCNTVFISSICYHLFILQWNPVNTVANGAKKNGRINGVAVLTRVFYVWQ